MKKTLFILLMLFCGNLYAQNPVITNQPQNFLKYIWMRDSVRIYGKLYLKPTTYAGTDTTLYKVVLFNTSTGEFVKRGSVAAPPPDLSPYQLKSDTSTYDATKYYTKTEIHDTIVKYWQTTGSDVRFSGVGNIGIGTLPLAPYKVKVTGFIRSERYFLDNLSNIGSDGLKGYWTNGSSTKPLYIILNNIPLISALHSAPRVGINDSTPSYTLDVNGTSQFIDTAFFRGKIKATGLGFSATNDTLLGSHNGILYKILPPIGFDSTHYWTNLFINKISPKTTFQLIIPLASKQIALTTDSVMNLSPNGTVKLSPKKTLSTYFRLYPLFTGVGTVSSLDSVKITIDSCGVYRSSSLIADDGTITISLAKSGRGWVSAGDDEARTWFYFKTDGTITLGSSDVISSVNNDTDTYLCVFDNTGNSFKIRNRLGASKVITYEILVGK